LLGRAQFGRIALTVRAIPVVFPVRYALNDGELRFVVQPDQIAQALDRAVAALQADGFEEDSGRRWTVFAAGPTRRSDSFENLGPLAASLSLGPDTPSGGLGALFSLQPVILSGRWIETL